MSQFYICGEYDPDSGKVGPLLFFVLPAEVELIENYKSGDSLMVNGKEYVLGRRTFDKKSIIAQYELIRRGADLPGLPLD